MNIIKKLEKRILDISYKYKLGHISSCLTSLPIIYNIYKNKKPEDIFILSNGHAGLAYYVILEYFCGINAEKLYNQMGIHPCYMKDVIFCSTGSLGLGLSIGVGYTLANKNRVVNVLISDGECLEGIVWESLAFSDKYIKNLKIHININGFSAYDTIDKTKLIKRLKSFNKNIKIYKTNSFRKGILTNSIRDHYYNLSKEDYEKRVL
jgi:transketolase